jgi:hypothetical protein
MTGSSPVITSLAAWIERERARSGRIARLDELFIGIGIDHLPAYP